MLNTENEIYLNFYFHIWRSMEKIRFLSGIQKNAFTSGITLNYDVQITINYHNLHSKMP